jgi:hypothetical protein|tara:strand:+ start:126 stop:2342 length:2217 start_codon:yes stop_codon:yes gene_type:complete
MALQTSIPAAVPPAARIVSPRLAILMDEDRVVVYSAADPMYTCRRDDGDGLRLMAGMLSSLKLAPDTALAEALGVNRESVRRNRKLFEEGGSAALRSRKKGPKKPAKMTDDVCARAQLHLDEGWTILDTAREIGVTDGTLHYAFKQRRLVRPSRAEAAATAPRGAQGNREQVSGPATRAAEDQACEQGVAVKRTSERALACTGKLCEAPAIFKASEAVEGAGVLLALPALLEQGLIDVGQSVYGSLRNGFFGLRSVLLTLCFMALLRIKNPEQLTGRAPGELGLLLGLDRAPEVKTLRGKLAEMGKRKLARLLHQRLTERWTSAEPNLLGLLYVDGHVRPYHGRLHKLPEHHVQRRGRPMPGTQDFHVNDERLDPLLCVTAEATESLLAMLDQHLLPEVRRLVGPRRRVTIVFDREGWSPEYFKRWKEQRFDLLTYRKGKQTRWQERFFTKRTRRVDGRKVTYCLAERSVKLSNGLSVREVRRLTDDGHQTAVISTCQNLSTFQVAYRMFNRWRQENFFRYCRHEFALDHLCTNAVEPADPKRLAPNPQRTKLDKQLRSARSSRSNLVIRRGELKPGETARADGRTLSEDELDALILKNEREVDRLKTHVSELPKKVPLDEILDPDEIVRLEPERKLLTDAFKMIAYRAESSLARLIEPFFARHKDEAHKFLQSVFRATADLIPDERRRTLTIRFHGLSNPRSTRALRALCEIVSTTDACYPGTDLRLHFVVPECHTN